MAKRRLEELKVYQKGLAGVSAVSAIMAAGTLRKECHGQLISAANAVPANIAEGYGQQSDRQFLRFLGIARGSAQEVRAHVASGCARGELDPASAQVVSDLYEEIAKMLTALMHYLRDANVRERR